MPEQVKSERLAILQAELNAQQVAFNKNCVGKIMPVLLEKPGRYAGQLVGRSPYMQAVSVDADKAIDSVMGNIFHVEITGALPNSLAGRLLDPVSQVAAQ